MPNLAGFSYNDLMEMPFRRFTEIYEQLKDEREETAKRLQTKHSSTRTPVSASAPAPEKSFHP